MSSTTALQFLIDRQNEYQSQHAVEQEKRDEKSSNNLAESIPMEYEESTKLSDLETAVNLFREALVQRPAPHPLRTDSRRDLSRALVVRHWEVGQIEDLDEAIMGYFEALNSDVQLDENRRNENSIDDQSTEIVDLANTILTQFRQSEPISNLDAAVSLHREALLHHEPDVKRLSSLVSLAIALTTRFHRIGLLQDIDEAISLSREALALLPKLHPDRPGLLNTVSSVFLARFGKTAQPLDIQDGVSLRTEAGNQSAMEGSGNIDGSQLHGQQTPEDEEVAIGDEEAEGLGTFADHLLQEFEQTGQLSDLEMSISLYQDVLDRLPKENFHRPGFLNNLGGALERRFRQNGVIEDVNMAIELHREALMLLPVPYADRSASLINLASALGTRFGQAGMIEDVDEAIALQRDMLILLPASHPNRSALVGNLASVLGMRFAQTGMLQDLDKAISLHREALMLRPAPHPDRSMSLNNLAIILGERFDHTGMIQDADEAIALHREALVLQSSPHPGRSATLSNLAAVLGTRFGQTGMIQDVDEAIGYLQDALALLPVSHPNRSSSLNNLAMMLDTRFHQMGMIQDLDEAIGLHREALVLFPVPHPNRSSSLNNLATTLEVRFTQTGTIQDVNEAISLHREALVLFHAPHPSRSMSLNNLASALGTRFGQTGMIQDVDEAVVLLQEALELRAAPHPGRSASLTNFANTFDMRFSQTGVIQDVDEAIRLHREALVLEPAPHPNRSTSLNNLASTLDTRFGQTGMIRDLDEAIGLHREALILRPAPHPDRSMSLNNLAHALDARLSRMGMVQDLDEAIELQREALLLLPTPHPDRFMSLNNLANVLHTRFGHTGTMQDVDEAVRLNREALMLQPVPHPSRSTSLNSLASVLCTRFSQTGMIQDVDEAIGLYREALMLQSVPHPKRSMSLNNLGNALDMLFMQTGVIEDLDEAITLHREALMLLPAPHPDRPSSLNNLATVLETRFTQTGSIEGMNEAIALHREALELRPASHPDRFESLHNIANMLQMRFGQLSHLPDLEEALVVSRESFHMLPEDHPKKCKSSSGLAMKLMDMYHYTQHPHYLDDAIVAFHTAVTCESAPASERLRAAQSWAYHADSGNHASTLDAYQHAVRLLPRLVTLGLDVQARRDILTSGTDDLARNAAACALRAGYLDLAVELLEEGRNIFWSQALKLRTPFDELHHKAPDLALKLQNISRALEQGALRDVSSNSSDTKRRLSLELEAAHYRRLDRDWLSAVEEVRRLNGFESFLRSSPLAELRSAAANGPVVILNSSESGCAAVIMTSFDIHHVPLPKCTMKVAQTLVQLIQYACGMRTDKVTKWMLKDLMAQTQSHPEPLYRDDRHGKLDTSDMATSDDIFLSALAILWTSVAEPVIRCLAMTKSTTPRLWWYPTGPFAFLPIHASGIYNIEDGERVSDYVISSYTPTLSALLSPSPPPTDNFKMLALIQPSAAGYLPLPSTYKELLRIEKHVPDECLVKLGIPGDPVVTVENVLSHLSTISIIHLACHGVQYTKNPLDSALILGDNQKLRISRIMEQPMPNASLAFLSACETAMGDEDLPDEAIHLAASLLFAGFRGVVATLWSMADEDGPTVTDSFYGHLFESAATDNPRTGPDTTQAARALHMAVTELRKKQSSFKRWVPFIHFGL